MVSLVSPTAPRLPRQRGPVSQWLVQRLAWSEAASATPQPSEEVVRGSGILSDDDRLMALWVAQGLSCHGFAGVDARCEVDPDVVALRLALEDALESDLSRVVAPVVARHLTSATDDLVRTLFDLPRAEFTEAPSIASFARREMSHQQWREMLILKSAYQLKEGDPHTFAIPRLPDEAKLPLLEIQFDEYGNGRLSDQHSRIFAEAMRSVELSDRYGDYCDAWPCEVLAANTALGWWASRREWVGAVAGHLAFIETTSSLPCQEYVAGARRLKLPEQAHRYFGEHVEADAAHEQIAIRQMCTAVAAADPAGTEKVLYGFLSGLYLEGRVAQAAVGAWRDSRSALLQPAVGAA